MIVYDVTRPITFETVIKWKKEIDEKVKFPDGSALPAILLGKYHSSLKGTRYCVTVLGNLYCYLHVQVNKKTILPY